MLWLYRLAARSIYLPCYLYGRGKADRGDMVWKGRLGLHAPAHPCRLWLHAASAGEVNVTAHLADYLLARDPSLRIHLTTMTRAGFGIALQRHTSPNISISYFPLDSPVALRRTFDAVRPELLVIAETEIWPNLIAESERRGIPVILVNGRMTEKAFKRYRLMRRVMASVLRKYDRFFFKTDDDAARYLQFGIDRTRAIVTGDMKFDAPLLDRTEDIVRKIRKDIGVKDTDFVLVAGSTRPGEEVILADVYTRLSQTFPDLVMIIAPRHVERTGEVKALLEERMIRYRILGSPNNDERVILVDRLGLLNDLYRAADMAFVGGTLVDIGGHNLLEPVWAGCPVLFGPSLHNVQEAADYIIGKSYGALVRDEEELLSLLKKTIEGDIMFQTKRRQDLDASPTAQAGDYILGMLKDD